MIYHTFDEYWNNFGKFHNSVIKHDIKLECDFYELAKIIWEEAPYASCDAYVVGHSDGWDAAEEFYKIKEEDKA